MPPLHPQPALERTFEKPPVVHSEESTLTGEGADPVEDPGLPSPQKSRVLNLRTPNRIIPSKKGGLLWEKSRFFHAFCLRG